MHLQKLAINTPQNGLKMPVRWRNPVKVIAITMLTAYSQIAQVTAIESTIKCTQYVQYFICEEVHIGYLVNRDWKEMDGMPDNVALFTPPHYSL